MTTTTQDQDNAAGLRWEAMPQESERLEEYRKRRSFDKTPEPAGDVEASVGDRFVVQEHHARRLHWDLRLERDGVLASWALPRGFPDDPKQNRLAIHTEDHPVEYLSFEGDIPSGEYGAGHMTVWDRGTYEAEKFNDREVIAWLYGSKVRGKFALFQTDGKNWLIHRMSPAVEEHDPMPASVAPMTATVSARIPRNQDEWGFEVSWSGLRAICYGEPGHVRMTDASLQDVSSAFPKREKLARNLGARKVILDGILVEFGAETTYVIVDVLYLDGYSLLSKPYEERRRRLDELSLSGSHWQAPAYHRGDGTALRAAAHEQGLRGIVAKRLTSTYHPGESTKDWREIRAPDSR